MILIPVFIVMRGAWRGLPGLVQHFALSREISASILFGALATALAFYLARYRFAVWLSVPALLGSLVLALSLLALFQFAWPLRDTIVPVVLALMFGLLPNAVLLRRALDPAGNSPALHVARQVPKSGPLIWALQTRRQFWIVFILFCLAYLELTASAILAPIALTPASVRLYNLMHYGRTAALSAMLLVVLIVPIVFAAIYRYALATRTNRA
jgi:ABC-type Fe3+ transport system permease subunit